MCVRRLIIVAFSSFLFQSGLASADEALANQAGCLDCHSEETKVVGPAFNDIATRYANNPQASATLLETVKNGGKGNWTETAITGRSS